MSDHQTDESDVTRELLLEYERRAETAYSAMYDAQRWDEKDLKDDALFYLARAIRGR